MADVDVVDCNGKPIVVGSRVRVDTEGPFDAVVDVITDPDGDVDDYGRSIGIPPYVYVTFDDGDGTKFSTSWTAKGWWDEDAPYECDDLEVAAETKEAR